MVAKVIETYCMIMDGSGAAAPLMFAYGIGYQR